MPQCHRDPIFATLLVEHVRTIWQLADDLLRKDGFETDSTGGADTASELDMCKPVMERQLGHTSHILLALQHHQVSHVRDADVLKIPPCESCVRAPCLPADLQHSSISQSHDAASFA